MPTRKSTADESVNAVPAPDADPGSAASTNKRNRKATPAGADGMAAAGPAGGGAPAQENQAAAPAPHKPHKGRARLVRDGFTMPEDDFELIAVLKRRLLANARDVKKSELLRAGLRSLNTLDDAALVELVDQLEKVKTGRPKKGH